MSVERDQVPRPWPFPSTDPRMVDEPEDDACENDSPCCECNAIPTIEEDDWNQCMSCGKPIK